MDDDIVANVASCRIEEDDSEDNAIEKTPSKHSSATNIEAEFQTAELHFSYEDKAECIFKQMGTPCSMLFEARFRRKRKWCTADYFDK